MFASSRAIKHAQVTKKMDEKKQAKRSRCKTFIKNINYAHLMPTRYTLDVELKNVVTSDAVGQRHQEGCGAKGGEEASRGAIQDWQVSLVLHPSCLLSVVRRRKAIGEKLRLGCLVNTIISGEIGLSRVRCAQLDTHLMF